MRRRTLLVTVTALVATAVGGGYCLWVNRGLAGPPPPVPAGLSDPQARQLIERKRQAVLAAPRSGNAWGELGMAFDAHDASADEARICYRRAMDIAPKDARWPFLLAEQMNWRGYVGTNKGQALEMYRRSADCPPPSDAHRATAQLSLADLLTELGRGDEAASLYRQVYAADPDNPWAAHRVGVLLADRGETEEAGKILLRLARNPFARKKAAFALAELSRRAGRAKDADEFEYTASLLPPDRDWPNPFAAEVAEFQRGRRVLMAQFSAQEGARDDRAAVHTATSLADQYPSVETQIILLRALVNVGDHPAALAVGDDILRDGEGKGMATAHQYLGLALLGMADRAEALGRKADAERQLAQAAASLGESARLKTDNAPAFLYRAKALMRLGRLKEAEAASRGAVQCRPQAWEGYLALAEVLATAGRKAEAITAAEQAVRLAHQNEPRPREVLLLLKRKGAKDHR
jgi:tetratricopeptide (TPR) repeat protein